MITVGLVLLLKYPGQLHCDILIKVPLQHNNIHLLAQNLQRSLVKVACRNQRRIQNLLVPLVHKVDKRQIAQFLHDTILPILQHVLCLFAHETVVANEQEHLMQHFFYIFAHLLLIQICISVRQQKVQEVVDLLP